MGFIVADFAERFVLAGLVPAFAALLFVTGCSSYQQTDRPFFQHEYGVDTHGRKTLFDRIIESDPGSIQVNVKPDFQADPPITIAVLPFSDEGSANFVVDKIPLTYRSPKQQNNWAWTDSQRLRRAMQGSLAQREFILMPLPGIDAVLKDRGIDSPSKLSSVAPEQLGKWLGVDAVVYGKVLHYEAYYFFLVAAWQVGIELRMVSTHHGEDLVDGRGSRYAVQLLPALTLEDIVINSAQNILQMRDILLARAEEEASREVVLRIPVSTKLRDGLVAHALENAGQSDTRTQGPGQELAVHR